MRAIAYGIAAGVLVALLVLVLGVTAAAYLAIAGSLVAIALGCVDYVKHHGTDG